ncbi:hypothetical protein QVD17_38559 [Tagetes erecta]|uniref:Uncharacterized protein n=1 Tax=Tagetes erecta TaxID=13708 RepID=A0AAD8JP42_TARER|nr:hypothetical protein QVD17_38559 [Tagetes erecta]
MDAPRRSTSRGGSQKRSGRGRGTGLSRGSGSSDPPPYFPQMHQQQPQFPMMQSAPGHQFNYSLQDDWSFDPFGARFNTPQPRDQYSQGSRANYIDYNDYNDYNDYEAEENQDVVPETQQFQNIHVDDDDDDDQEENLAGERAKKVQKFAGRAERQIWTPNQEENLAKAWVHISVDKKVGNQQPRDGFWKRVLKHYTTLEGGSTRTHHQLNSNPLHLRLLSTTSHHILHTHTLTYILYAPIRINLTQISFTTLNSALIYLWARKRRPLRLVRWRIMGLWRPPNLTLM